MVENRRQLQRRPRAQDLPVNSRFIVMSCNPNPNPTANSNAGAQSGPPGHANSNDDLTTGIQLPSYRRDASYVRTPVEVQVGLGDEGFGAVENGNNQRIVQGVVLVRPNRSY